MATPKDPDLEKKTLNLRRGDFEYIESLFPASKPSIVIRKILSKFVDNHSAKVDTPEVTETFEL